MKFVPHGVSHLDLLHLVVGQLSLEAQTVGMLNHLRCVVGELGVEDVKEVLAVWKLALG